MFFYWAYSPASGLGFKPSDNPVTWVKPPKVDKKIMPSQDKKSLEILLSHVDNTRDRGIISILIDSSGRLSEVSNIYEDDILWDKGVIKATAKGGREVLLPPSGALVQAPRCFQRPACFSGPLVPHRGGCSLPILHSQVDL